MTSQDTNPNPAPSGELDDEREWMAILDSITASSSDLLEVGVDTQTTEASSTTTTEASLTTSDTATGTGEDFDISQFDEIDFGLDDLSDFDITPPAATGSGTDATTESVELDALDLVLEDFDAFFGTADDSEGGEDSVAADDTPEPAPEPETIEDVVAKTVDMVKIAAESVTETTARAAKQAVFAVESALAEQKVSLEFASVEAGEVIEALD
ncbi:MAG: hypothetical protein AAF408_07690, partial [Pseudomonadota bacterium]